MRFKKSRDGFAPIVVVLALAAVFALIGGGYIVYREKTKVQPAASPVVENNQSANATGTLILADDKVLKIWPLGSVPDGIKNDAKVNVCFTSLLTGEGAFTVKALDLASVDKNGNTLKVLGNLKDDGQNCDLAEGDLVFSGKFAITSTQETALYFKTFAELPTEKKMYSAVYTLVVSGLPAELSPSDISKIVVDPQTGSNMLSNEVLVGFVAGTPDEKIEIIAKSVGGQVVGSIAGLGTYQIRFSGTGDAVGVKNVISALKKFKEVKTAEPNYVTTID